MSSNNMSSNKTKSKPALIGAIALSFAMTFALGYWVSRARAAGGPQVSPLTYSGVLSDMNGVPLTGSKSIVLQLYDSATGPTALCSSTPATVTLVAGAFQAALGDSCTPIVHSTPDLWIDVQVDGTSIGREKLGSVPFALEADHAQSASAIVANAPVAAGLTVYTIDGAALVAPCRLATTTGAIVDCACPAGSFVVSGGADAGQTTGHFIRETRAISATTWRITCADGTADVRCFTYQLLCSRVGP